MARPSELTKVGKLYFIESDAQNAVKIGFANDVYTRLKSLQSGNPDDLHLVVSVSCTYGAELALHRKLKSRRIRLEWHPDDDFMFWLRDEIEAAALDKAMEWLVDNAPDATGEDVLADAQTRSPITE
jgi:hypothetical protein